jgi:lysozyme family protein
MGGSAEDALTFDHLAPLTNTTVPGLLFAFESFNGFGTRNHNITALSMELFESLYKGKNLLQIMYLILKPFLKQIGAAVLLRRIMDRQLTLGESDTITQIRQLGEEVPYDPVNFNAIALSFKIC